MSPFRGETQGRRAISGLPLKTDGPGVPTRIAKWGPAPRRCWGADGLLLQGPRGTGAARTRPGRAEGLCGACASPGGGEGSRGSGGHEGLGGLAELKGRPRSSGENEMQHLGEMGGQALPGGRLRKSVPPEEREAPPARLRVGGRCGEQPGGGPEGDAQRERATQ